MNGKRLKRITLTVLFSSSLITTSVLSYNLLKSFDETKTWKRMSKAPLAELSPELLTADDNLKEQISKYKTLYQKIWNDKEHIFNKDVTQFDIDSLDSLFNKLPENIKQLSSDHSEILSLWNIKTNLENLTKNNSIPEKQTLNNIQSFLTTSFNTLHPYLLDDSHKEAASIYQNLQVLVNDSNQYAKVLDIIAQDYSINNTTVQTDMQSEHIDYLNSEVSKLHHKWMYIENKIKPLLLNSNNAILSNNNAVKTYNEYLADQKSKEDFETYYEQYKSEEAQLKAQIIELPNFKDKSTRDVYEWVTKQL